VEAGDDVKFSLQDFSGLLALALPALHIPALGFPKAVGTAEYTLPTEQK